MVSKARGPKDSPDIYFFLAGKEKYQQRHFSVKSEEEYKERTKIDLACHIGNAYFMQTR